MDGWLAQNWFNVLSAIGIIGGQIFAGVSLRAQTKAWRVSNLLTLTANHREFWTLFLKHPPSARVLDGRADLERQPITKDEEIFTNLAIQHLNSAHQTMQDKLVIKPEGLRRDVWWFFSLPIPNAVWEKSKILQDDDFVAFVEHCRNWK